MATDRLSLIFAALADPTRRAILARLGDGEATVTELAEPFDISLPAISRHLKVLERAGLITRGRDAPRRRRERPPTGDRARSSASALRYQSVACRPAPPRPIAPPSVLRADSASGLRWCAISSSCTAAASRRGVRDRATGANSPCASRC